MKLGTFAAELLIIAAAASPVAAQTIPVSTSPFDGDVGVESVAPETSYPLGQSESVARDMAASMHMTRQQSDLCWRYGCLIIANQSKTYRITEFRVQEAGAKGTLRWSRNQFSQFEAPLFPQKATYLFKTGKPETCDWPVMFVLVDVKRRETMKVQMRASLCTTPHQYSLIRVNVVHPQVTVGEGGE